LNATELTDTQIIAKAMNTYVKNGHDQKLKDIFVDARPRTFSTGKRGWRVFFIFEEPCLFGNAGIAYEVDLDGEVHLFQTM